MSETRFSIALGHMPSREEVACLNQKNFEGKKEEVMPHRIKAIHSSIDT